MSQTEVLVVGAGPVGLALAADLSKRGVETRIIDQSVGPSTTSKAIAIQPRTLEIFRHLGIADEVLARGYAVGAANFYSRGRLRARMEFAELGSTYGFLLDLPQNETEEVLRELLARHGVAVEHDTRLLRLEQDEKRAAVQVVRRGQNELIECSYVVGCDGAYSTVRHALDLKTTGFSEPQQLILGDMSIDWLYPHELHMFLHPAGFLACYPLSSRCYRLIADVTCDERLADAGRPPRATPERFREIVKRRADPDAALGEATWLAGFRIQRQFAETYGRGRVFVAGDAAHVSGPAGGQGMNAGIQDSENLAWKVHLALRGRAAPGLLDSYSAERAPVGRKVVGLSNHTAGLDAEAPFVEGEARASLLSQISELRIDYRESPIVAEQGGSGDGMQPGDRAPVINGLDGTAHQLLFFSGDQPDFEVFEQIARTLPEGLIHARLVTTRGGDWDDRLLHDRDGAVHRRFGATARSVFLIRPDGYVGYRSLTPDPDRLGAYLRKIFA